MTTGDNIRYTINTPRKTAMYSACQYVTAKRAKAEREAALVKAKDLASHPCNYTRATSYGAAKYVKKVDFDKETGEILTASSVLKIDEAMIREEEALDVYYVLLTSEMEESH
ncbi:MAG: hypothetical protein LUG83_00775 [Lachnospiraceae bacterium]|nr:hypothetical protein [Lachnospiraceae bacterium]